MRHAWIFIVFWVMSFVGIAMGSPAQAQSAKNDKRLCKANYSVDIAVELDSKTTPAVAYLYCKNNGKLPIWVPIQDLPVSRISEKFKTIELWIGYFKHPVGELMTDYRVPRMYQVQPGDEYRLEFKDQDVANALSSRSLKLSLAARFSTKALEYSEVRGQQPFVEYLSNSIVIKTSKVISR